MTPTLWVHPLRYSSLLRSAHNMAPTKDVATASQGAPSLDDDDRSDLDNRTNNNNNNSTNDNHNDSPTATATKGMEELIQKVQDIHIVSNGPAEETLEDDESHANPDQETQSHQTHRDHESPDPLPLILASIRQEVRTLAQWIEESQNILIVTGAGVSCSAGIPDFRTPGTGLYDNLQQYDLPFPEAVFDLHFFRRKPQPFVSLAHALWPSKHVPTVTHSFLTLLAHDTKGGKLLRNYSQNIDGLEHLAGMPADRLVECHGHFRTSSCIDCRRPMDPAQVERDILHHAQPTHCRHCGGLVKPDIVFFGEGLPERFHSLVGKDAAKADLCIVMGTSLQVAPVSMIPDMVDCRVALVNREPVGKGMDLFCQGDCDEILRDVAMVLGWHEELEQQHYDMICQRKAERKKLQPRGTKKK